MNARKPETPDPAPVCLDALPEPVCLDDLPPEKAKEQPKRYQFGGKPYRGGRPRRKKQPYNGRKRPPGRPRQHLEPQLLGDLTTPEAIDAIKGQIHREGALATNRRILESIRDIAPLSVEIDWPRRVAACSDFAYFCKTYLPNTFNLTWSESHKACIKKIEAVAMEGGKFALAMPRGHGKTALCRAALIWMTAYAHRLFPFLIGSAQPKAQASLAFVKAAWYGSKELRQDFPEIAHAVHKLENRWHLARGQIYNGSSTYIDWGTDSVRYPILLLPPEIAAVYDQHCPGFLIHLPGADDKPESWITRSAGLTINTAGVDGSIRGEAGVHPILLTQPRPDVVLIDDVQKDSKVDSSLSCDKLKLLIDGAIGLLSGPDKQIAGLMPCTVMREGDVADTYVDPDKRPEWRGERHARVLTWPPGIDDEKITLDTPAGLGWTEYDKLRRQSLREYKDIRLATAYYEANRLILDEHFTVSWEQNYDPKVHLSAQQSAMTDRLEIGSVVFMAECQNKGRRPLGEGIISVRAEQLREKTISLAQRRVPVDTRSLVVQVDVQNEIFYWSAFACSPDFTGVITDYGTYPPVNSPYFRKAQTEEWSLLSRTFFEAYPEQRAKATQSAHGWRAPLEAKIYHGLGHCIRHLLSLQFHRDDQFSTPIHIHRIGIDTRWGQVTDTVKRFIRDWSKRTGSEATPTAPGAQSGWIGREILIPYYGQGITPLQKQMEEFTRTRGWLFEDQINPRAKEVRWIWKPDEMGVYSLMVDVNRMKTFLFQRLASPPGTPGSVSLYDAPPEVHELFADHLCKSEFPYDAQVNTLTQSLRKQMWKAREGIAFDNDFLDTATGCMALASFNGSFLQHDDADRGGSRIRRRMSDVWRDKRDSNQ